MTSAEVASHTLWAIEKGRHETILTFKGKLIALVARFFPWFADMVTKRKVRGLFLDEIAARKQAAAAPQQAEAAS
jgi:DNA-binding XRE family transcriptional regulator